MLIAELKMVPLADYRVLNRLLEALKWLLASCRSAGFNRDGRAASLVQFETIYPKLSPLV
jgi:hypothetical protein